MRFADRPSWEFRESDNATVHGALYVRDALRLEIGDDPANPPPLRGVVPDRSELLEPAAREAAARQWPSWWRALVGWETGPQPDVEERAVFDGSERESWIARAGDRLAAAGLPPDFAGLSDRPELRRGAQATYSEGRAWPDAPWLAVDSRDERGAFPWAMVREVAEDVAFDRGVGIGAVRGSALVLAVDGVWWQYFAPGVVCCSRSAAADPKFGRTILRRTFESNLSG